MIKNFKTSMIHSIVSQGNKLSARSASLESNAPKMILQDIEEARMLLSLVEFPQDNNILEQLNRVSILKNSAFGGKLNETIKIYEVRSEVSSLVTSSDLGGSDDEEQIGDMSKE